MIMITTFFFYYTSKYTWSTLRLQQRPSQTLIVYVPVAFNCARSKQRRLFYIKPNQIIFLFPPSSFPITFFFLLLQHLLGLNRCLVAAGVAIAVTIQHNCVTVWIVCKLTIIWCWSWKQKNVSVDLNCYVNVLAFLLRKTARVKSSCNRL